jgi:UDP:flavonoid glycosyltransferase YjiC (YdhE family)
MATIGSLGDLHPYIALALEMKKRHLEPVIATSNIFRERIESLGIEFHRLRPDMPEQGSPEYVAMMLPRVAAMVHQGGVGTTGQGLRAGVPMLVVPFAHDQPDNGMRVERLGVARNLAREQYQGERVASELKELLAIRLTRAPRVKLGVVCAPKTAPRSPSI